MELFHLPRAQLKSRLGKQKSRHFCRMGHDGIMSARELQKAPVGPGPSIGSAGCRNREGGRGAVNEGCRTARSEEHTSELQSLMRISYAVFCLKKKTSSNRVEPP